MQIIPINVKSQKMSNPVESNNNGISTDEKARQDVIEILEKAVKLNASDIHFAPYSKKTVHINYRIDGKIMPGFELGAIPYRRVAFYLRELAGMQRATRRPDSKRIRVPLNGSDYHFRMESAHSFPHDAAIITLRYIPNSDNLISLDNIGFEKSDLLLLKSILMKQMGMLLVSGPTGSGKTTTLYASLIHISKTSSQKIITVEHPIDSPLPGTTQLEPRNEITLEDLLKSAMRHDPDILMIGEIRDTLSAIETLKAAQTGHLVLTTVHANSALTAITKMISLGLDPYSFVTSTRAVLSQRLVQRLCHSCREPSILDETEISSCMRVFGKVPERAFRQGKGCNTCNNKGFKGRIIAYELFPLDLEDQDLIIKTQNSKKSLDTLKKQFGKKYETKTLPQRLYCYIQDGRVSLQDAIRML